MVTHFFFFPPQDIKEVTKKPLKMRAPRIWADEEIAELRKLYEEYKDAMDPINRILDHLTVKRPKARVIEKILDLGLCDDKKKLKKKRTQRGLKEGDPGYLKSASESDSALDDSTEYDTYESDEEGSEDFQESIRTKALEVSRDPVAKPGILWLKSCLEDELEDRDNEEDEENEPVPIVPITENCILAMECPAFLSILQLIGLASPNDQEQYWRIPSDFSSKNLSEKAKFLDQLAEDELDLSVLDLDLVVKKISITKERKVKKVKKKKTWMPMRRTLNADVADRIHNAVAAGSKSQASPSTKKAKKAKRIVTAESSSDSEKETEDTEAKFRRNSGSNSRSEASKNSRKIQSENSSSSEEEEAVADNPSFQDKADNETASQRKKIRKPRSLSSSSSSGVDDPWPLPRVPSDSEEMNNKTMEEASTTANTIRSRSSSRSSSSSRSYRSPSTSSLSSRSPSPSLRRSPAKSQLISSSSNTPKRTRSPASSDDDNAKSGTEKKRQKRILDDTSSEDESMPTVTKKKNVSVLASSDDED